MNVEAEIEDHIAAQPAPKGEEMRALHQFILGIAPGTRLWFLDGKDSKGKMVANPNIGYGFQTMHYAGGKTRDFYQVGFSANTAGISIYIIGLADKKHLAQAYGKRLGKASVTGYCIKFKTLADLDLGVLEEAIRFGLNPSES